jgi:hypothetical protein
MRRASKSPNGVVDSNNTPHENKTSDTMQANTIAVEPFVGEVTLKEKHQLIAEAAYYRAERRNFAPGYELADWLNAEEEIEAIDSHPR